LSVQFLSEEFMAAANEALAGHEGFAAAISGVQLALQFNVTDLPEGDDVAYFIDVRDGASTAQLGEVDTADVTVTNDYETAVGISTGELNTQMAFMTGKLKVSGDMAKLMLNQAVINEMTRALSEIDATY